MNERRYNSLDGYDIYLSEIRSSYEGSEINELLSFAPVLLNHPENTSTTQSISSEINELGLSTVLNDQQELKTIHKSHNTIELIENILDSVNSTLEKLRKISNVSLVENTSSATSIVMDTPSSMITDTIITDYEKMEILMPKVLNDRSLAKQNMYHRVGSSTSDNYITNLSETRRNNLASDNHWCNTRTKVFRSYSDTSISGNESFRFPLLRTRSMKPNIITACKKYGETDDSFGSSTRLTELGRRFERWNNKERGTTTREILPSDPYEIYKAQPKQSSDSSLQTITTKMSQSDSTVQPIIIIETSSLNSRNTTIQQDSTDGQSPEQLFASYYLKQNTLEGKDVKDDFENEMQEVLMSQRGGTSNDIFEENHKGMCEKPLHNSPSLVSGESFIDLINSFVEINQNLNTHIYVEIPNNNENLEIKTFETKSEIEINSANLQEIFSSDVQDASSEVLSVVQKSAPCFDSKNESSVDLSFTSSTHHIKDVFKMSKNDYTNKKILNYNNYKTLNTIEYQNNKVNSKAAKPVRTYTRRGRNNSVNVVENKKIHKNVSSTESAGTRINTLKKKTNMESNNQNPILNISNTNIKMPMRIKSKPHTNSQHTFSKGKGNACQTILYRQKIKQQLQKERILSNNEIMKWVTQSEQAPVNDKYHAISEEDMISSQTIDLNNNYPNMDGYVQNKSFADSFSQQNFKEESSEREFINAVAIIYKKFIGPGPVEPSFVSALHDALKIVLINRQRQSICRDQLSVNISGESSMVASDTGFMNVYPTVDKPYVSEERATNIPKQYYTDDIVEARLQKMFEHYKDSLTESVPCTMGLSKTEDSIQSSDVSLTIWGQPDCSVTTRLCSDKNVTFNNFSNNNQSDVNMLPELDGKNSQPAFDTVLSTKVSRPVKVGPSTSESSSLIHSTSRRYKPSQVKSWLNYSQNTRNMFKRRSSDEYSSLRSGSCCSKRLQRLSLPRASYVKNTILQYSDVLSSDSLKRLDRIAAANRPTCAPNREKSLKKKKFSSKLQLGVKRVMSSPTCTIKLGGYVFVGTDDNYRPPHMSPTEKQSGTDENSSSEMTVYMGSYRDSHRDRVPFDNILDESKYNDNSTTEEETCITLNDIQTIVKQTPPKSINVVSCHTWVALVKETATVHYISWEYVTVQHLESVHYSYVPHGVQTTIILMIVFLFIWLVFRAFSFILP